MGRGTEDVGPGTDEVLASLIAGSDWLQRRVADEADPLPPLMRFAEFGRTKKVRARAGERVVQVRPRLFVEPSRASICCRVGSDRIAMRTCGCGCSSPCLSLCALAR